jgi:hypothetical protein
VAVVASGHLWQAGIEDSCDYSRPRRAELPLSQASSSCFRPVVWLDSQAILGSPPAGLMPSFRMFFAALTSASKMLPQLVQTKRDRLMRLEAATVPQALQHCEVSARSTHDDPGSVPRRFVLQHRTPSSKGPPDSLITRRGGADDPSRALGNHQSRSPNNETFANAFGLAETSLSRDLLHSMY